jgi:hypothetical protein
MPYKTWSVNEILTAADMNVYVGDQVIATFAGTAARSSAIGTPVEGQFAFMQDTDTLTYYTGSNWVDFSAGGGGGGFEQTFLLMGA